MDMSVGLSGDIFTLGGEGEYDGKWQGVDVLRANAGVDVRVTLTAEANFCHGVSIALGAGASAQAQAALSIFLSLGVEGQAFARAKANLSVSLAPDLFDRFGLVADVGAIAEAAVAGKLKIGLNISQIKQLSEVLLGENSDFIPNQVALDIFGYFLDELEINAGVWGRVAFSAMAQGHLEVYGSLADPQTSGFVIEFGGSIGLEAGTGWDGFAVAKLRDVHRFYARTADRITQEVVSAAFENLEPEYQPIIQLIDLCLPAVLQIALVAGQSTATNLMANSDNVVRPTIRAILEQMRRFILRKFTEVAERMMVELVDDMTELLLEERLDEAQRDEVKGKVESLVDQLREVETWDLDLVIVLSADLTDIATIIFNDDEEYWKQPLTVAWCGLAALHALDETQSAFTGSGSASFLGFGVSLDLSEDDFDLPAAPEAVLDEFESFLGARPITLRLSDAIDYIVDSSVGPHIDSYLPELGTMMEFIEDTFELTAGDFVSAFLLGSVGGNLSSTELYEKLRDFLRRSIDDEIDARLIPALKSSLGDGDAALLYINEVVEPSLLGCTNFVFHQIDDIVDGNLSAAAFDSFRLGLSTLVYKVAARNVIVLGNILHEHVLDGLEIQLAELRSEVEADPNHIMASTAVPLARTLTVSLVSEQTIQRATHRLVTQMIAAGQAMFGSNVWNNTRREAMRRLMLEALVGDDSGVDYRANSDLIRQAFAVLADCNHKPNEQALTQLGALLGDVVLEQLSTILDIVAPALMEFFLAITSEAVLEMDRIAREFIDEIAELADKALRQLRIWTDEANRLKEQLETLTLQAANQLSQIETHLENPATRQVVIGNIYVHGLNQVVQGVASATLGWNSLNDNTKAVALAVPIAAYDTAFSLARPFIDRALNTIGNFAGDLEDSLVAATNVDDVVSTVIDTFLMFLKDEVNQQISQFGLVLPDSISAQDMAEVAKATLITDEVGNWLRAAWISISNRNNTNLLKLDAEREAAEARVRHNTEIARRNNLLGDQIGIHFHSPASLSGPSHENFVYGPLLPIKVDIDGARNSFAEPGTAQRIYFALNGMDLSFHLNGWRETSSGIQLAAQIDFNSSPLKAGFNVLECSVSDGIKDVIRETVSFIVDPTAPVINQIKVIPQESTFDVPEVNDHVYTSKECVAFINSGNTLIQLDNWTLQDKAGHAYTFPKLAFVPNSMLRVFTGAGNDSEDSLYWGRNAAIWNNTGDSIYLIDENRILRSEFVYESLKRS